MDESSWCNFCQAITDTHEWDCQVCGLSKIGTHENEPRE